MFETTAVESRKKPLRTQPLLTLPVSVALHAAALAGLLFAGTWSVDMPENAPEQIAAFVVRVPAPAFPAGGGAPRPARPTAPAPPRESSPAVPATEPDLAPAEVPDTIPDLQPGDGDADQDSSGPGSGLPGPGDGSGDGDGMGTGEGPGIGDGIGDGAGDGPLPVGGSVVAPVVLRRIEPRYPQLLMKLRSPGAAVVECIVNRQGQVESVKVISATHELFGDAAAAAVKQWRFRAGTLNGTPVKTIFQLRVTFEMTR